MARRKEPTWEEAIKQVLRESDSALSYTEIAERVSEQGIKEKIGANPAHTVAVTLSTALRSDRPPFQRVSRGGYALSHEGPKKQKGKGPTIRPAEEQDEAESGAIRALGMYWARDQVIWKTRGRMLGRQQAGSLEVDFAGQVGVYLLHDRDRTIYVGRATESIYSRLQQHTIDRLSPRWDRFSWFGLCNVNDDGSLTSPATAWNHTDVIETLEALLIECIEPPLNRRRGDNLAAVEYIQVADAEIQNRETAQVIREFQRWRGGHQ